MKYEGKVSDLIRDNHAQFLSVKRLLDDSDYVAEYEIPDRLPDATNWYRFSIPLSEIGTGTLLSKEKAIYFMKWLNKAMKNDGLFFYRQTNGEL